MVPSAQSTRMNLTLSSDTCQLAGARKAVEKFCNDCGVGPEACDAIGLCVNEALANVMRHAYQGAAGKPITLQAEHQPRRLEVKIRDWGNGVNPEDLPDKSKDPLTPGGLGLLCLRQLMDDISFQPQNDGMLMIMIKNV